MSRRRRAHAAPGEARVLVGIGLPEGRVLLAYPRMRTWETVAVQGSL